MLDGYYGHDHRGGALGRVGTGRTTHAARMWPSASPSRLRCQHHRAAPPCTNTATTARYHTAGPEDGPLVPVCSKRSLLADPPVRGQCTFYLDPGYDGLGAVLSRGLLANLTASLWGCRAFCPMPRRRLADTVVYGPGALYCHAVRQPALHEPSSQWTYSDRWLTSLRCWDDMHRRGLRWAHWLPCADYADEAAAGSSTTPEPGVTCKITKAFIAETLAVAERVAGGRMNSARANAHANAHVEVEDAKAGLERMRRVYRRLHSERGSDDQDACGFAPVSKSEADQVIEIAVHIRLGDRASSMAPPDARLAPLHRLAATADQVSDSAHAILATRN